MKSRFIYLIKPIGMDGPVKIGCSNKPVRRLLALSVWSPFPLEVVAVAPGDIAKEKVVHRHFEDELLHREWFQPSPRLLAFCDALKRNVPLDDALAAIDQREAA